VGALTKLNKAKRKRLPTRSFQCTLRWEKKAAQRAYRRAARQAISVGREVNEKPRLTDRDIV